MYLLNWEAEMDGSAGHVYDFDRSTMNNRGQVPKVTGSVEARSHFESTTVGKFEFGGD